MVLALRCGRVGVDAVPRSCLRRGIFANHRCVGQRCRFAHLLTDQQAAFLADDAAPSEAASTAVKAAGLRLSDPIAAVSLLVASARA
jgi:hypothetical protein